MKKINYFPYKQSYCLIYSGQTYETQLFKNLCLQISPKNSIFYRALKTKSFLKFREYFKLKFNEVPFDGEFLGLLKPDTIILFQLKDNIPVYVWKKGISSEWVQMEFLGYQLFSEYSKSEFDLKKKNLKKVLKSHWFSIQKNTKNIHGDFTHFNVLIGENDKIHLIDKKSSNHSKIFDIFYFYSYFSQCLSKCQTISQEDQNYIISELNIMIREICNYSSKYKITQDISKLNIPKSHGVMNINQAIINFEQIFYSNYG